MNINKPSWTNPSLSPDERADDLISRMTLVEKCSQLLHESPEIERLGVPAYNWWNECLHGVARAGRATIFPQAIGLAATFDEALLERVADAISDEGRAKHHAAAAAGNRGQYRGLTFWTPNVNIFRDPRWGRGQETYGEDPWLTSRLGLAFLRGLQQEKNGIMKAAGCAKHFAVHSGPEALRHEFDAVVSEQDLRATYLPAFEALVRDGKVEAVMGAYNRTNGEACCASPTLLGRILRGEWGFEGHVVSDCWAVQDFHEHHKITKTPEESAALAINAGCDLNCGCTFEHAVSAVQQGRLTEETVNTSLKRLLISRFKLGLLNPPESDPWRSITLEVVDSPKHRALARKTAVESMVLLKNNGILPLTNDIKYLYITGPNADNPAALLGNYYGMNPRVVTPLQGLVDRVPESTTVDFRTGALLDREKPNPVDWAVFEAERADVTVAFMGLDGSLEGEEGDALASMNKGDREDIGLPTGQLDFLRRMKERGARLVVVLTGGSALAVRQVHELADALIMAWYPGEESGSAVADILYGDENPSGRLPVTFYDDVEDLPPYDDYAMEGRTYRYFRKEPLYPFGFGLSYTKFEYSEPVFVDDSSGDAGVLAQGGRVTVSVTVTNTGTRRGAEVVQIYALPPEAPFAVPSSELRGLRRIELEAGESRRLEFVLEDDALNLYDDTGRKVRLPGEWGLEIGACSPGARGSELGASEPARLVLRVV
ncbi:MAG: glycoside hydrolase family 3 C-terminal domain-containing protein [Spirochaetaceae bacterium]|nr:glycoside hydrolase family 3 C-terminal domain-containing protein [Spirochaetaceae bacterium]